jgi:hypothetical protein
MFIRRLFFVLFLALAFCSTYWTMTLVFPIHSQSVSAEICCEDVANCEAGCCSGNTNEYRIGSCDEIDCIDQWPGHMHWKAVICRDNRY